MGAPKKSNCITMYTEKTLLIATDLCHGKVLRNEIIDGKLETYQLSNFLYPQYDESWKKVEKDFGKEFLRKLKIKNKTWLRSKALVLLTSDRPVDPNVKKRWLAVKDGSFFR